MLSRVHYFREQTGREVIWKALYSTGNSSEWTGKLGCNILRR